MFLGYTPRNTRRARRPLIKTAATSLLFMLRNLSGLDDCGQSRSCCPVLHRPAHARDEPGPVKT